MAWIESHQSLATHRKTKALQRLLHINTVRAIGHLHLMWWWCLDNAPDGNLKGIEAEDIAEAAQWTGNARDFQSALVLSGFLDKVEGEKWFTLHEWGDYAGKLQERRIANRERMKAIRAAHVQHTNSARASLEERTGPTGPTEEERREENTQESASSAFQEIVTRVGQNIQTVTPVVRETLTGWFHDFGEENLCRALNEAVKYNKRSLAYVQAVLEGKPTDKFSKQKYSHMVVR